MEPRIKRFYHNLIKDKNEIYFELSEKEKKLVAHKIKMVVLQETINIIGDLDKNNIMFVMEISIENLQSLLCVFEDMELYSKCQMMLDAIKEIENDIQELVTTQL